MSKEKEFIEGKRNTLQKLRDAITKNEVDVNILQLLKIINDYDNYYTTSSCFGRIVLLEIPTIGDKKNARFLGKWHRTIDLSEIKNAKDQTESGQIWLLAQSPVIHIVAKTIFDADKILKLAVSCGFKNSGIKSFDKKIVVEICSTERLDAPIGNNKKIFCDDEYLDLLKNISNEVINKSTEKLHRFQKKLKDK